MPRSSILALGLAALVAAHGDHGSHEQTPIGPLQSLWYNTLPGDGGTQARSHPPQPAINALMMSLTEPQADSVFSGISTFGRLPYLPCLASKDINYDIAFIG